MYLTPLIRINRAIASTYICPDHPLKAIAISESISLFTPLLNPKLYSKTVAHIITFLYNPGFLFYILRNYEKSNLIYNQAEFCFLILFNLLFNFKSSGFIKYLI